MSEALIKACQKIVAGEFWADRVVPADNGCLVWTGAHIRNGYGSLKVGRQTMLAHRIAWIAVNGLIDEGVVLDHLCRVRDCVNIKHLEPVTSGENTRRGFALITRCPNGHPLEGENLIAGMAKLGRRACLTCNREKDTERHELIRQAHTALGIPRSEYRKMFGSSAKAARAVLAASPLIRADEQEKAVRRAEFAVTHHEFCLTDGTVYDTLVSLNEVCGLINPGGS